MSLLDLQSDPAAFRAALLIDTDSGPRPFADVMDDFQRHDFEALDNGWKRAAGQEVSRDCCQRGWLERGRGHSKSSDVMVSATWALFASRRQLSGVVCAVDRDQAALDRDHVGRLVSLNPWLSKVIDVQQWRILNRHTGSAMEIMASDVASSYGLLVDFAVCDEVSLWPKRDLFDSILSSAAKRSTCLLLCIGNAGFQDSWVWNLREAIRADDRWHFSRLEGPVASWITAENLAEQRKLLPSVAFDRLWLNIWVSAGGDALSEAVITRAFDAAVRPQTRAVAAFDYVAGVDLGVSRDASAVCVLGVRRSHQGHGRIQLAATKVWRPRKGAKVDLQAVEDALADLHATFNFCQLNFDPWQMTHMASRLQSGNFGRMVKGSDRKPRLPMVEIPPVGANLQRIATSLIESFNDYRVALYPDEGLERDLRRLRVEERPYGFRLVSPHDELGHGDLGTAFSLALLAASELAAKKVITAGAIGSNNQPGQQPLTALERAYKRIDDENAYRRYVASLPDDEDEPPGFRRLMNLWGR
jgi:phage terminase large subunit-like protein